MHSFSRIRSLPSIKFLFVGQVEVPLISSYCQLMYGISINFFPLFRDLIQLVLYDQHIPSPLFVCPFTECGNSTVKSIVFCGERTTTVNAEFLYAIILYDLGSSVLQ